MFSMCYLSVITEIIKAKSEFAFKQYYKNV